MTQKLSIGNYTKMIRSVIFTLSFSTIVISIWGSLLTYKIIEQSASRDIVAFLIPIVLFPLAMFIYIWRNSSREFLSIIDSGLKSEKYGLIELSSIKSYKVSIFRAAESLIITLNNGTKYGIGPLPLDTKVKGTTYDKFKTELLSSIAMENSSRITNGLEEIEVEKSNLKPVFIIGISIILIGAIIIAAVTKN